MPYREFGREQDWLLPPSFNELLGEDHRARFVAAFVDGLERETWEELDVEPGGNPLGAGAYHPRALLSVWVYGFMNGVRSTRKLEVAWREQLPYMWLAGMQRPDHNTLWRFYSAHRERMRVLLRRTVRVAVRAGLVDLAVQAVDGTKIASNASKDRTFDEVGLRRLLGRVELKIEELEASNTTGGEAPAPSLPKGLVDAHELRQRINEALAEDDREERGKYTNLTDKDGGLLHTRDGFIAGYNAQALVSPLRSPDSPGDRTGDQTVPQSGGSGTGMIITAAEVTAKGDDHPWLIPMIEESQWNTGGNAGGGGTAVTLADAGYHSGANLATCELRGYRVLMPETTGKKRRSPYHKDHFIYQADSDSYRCPQGATLSYVDQYRHQNGYISRRYRARGPDCQACSAFLECTSSPHGRTIKVGEYEEHLRRHRELMATPEARELYRQRKALVEPAFGILKEEHGATRFLLRGKAKVRAEWSLLATAFNLKSLKSLWRRWRRWRVGFPPEPDTNRPQQPSPHHSHNNPQQDRHKALNAKYSLRKKTATLLFTRPLTQPPLPFADYPSISLN